MRVAGSTDKDSNVPGSGDTGIGSGLAAPPRTP